jgi:hypothetical protein
MTALTMAVVNLMVMTEQLTLLERFLKLGVNRLMKSLPTQLAQEAIERSKRYQLLRTFPLCITLLFYFFFFALVLLCLFPQTVRELVWPSKSINFRFILSSLR